MVCPMFTQEWFFLVHTREKFTARIVSANL